VWRLGTLLFGVDPVDAQTYGMVASRSGVRGAHRLPDTAAPRLIREPSRFVGQS
jgi:hypothetical protein